MTTRRRYRWLVANSRRARSPARDERSFLRPDFASDLVAADKDVIILRTFSKLYGMAGLASRRGRWGGTAGKLKPAGAGIAPITGMVAGPREVSGKTLVMERRKALKRVREDTFAFREEK